MEPNGTRAPQGQEKCGLVPIYNHITLMIIRHSEIKRNCHSPVSLLERYFLDVCAFGFSSSVGVCKLLF